jgi:hypothetical protein
MARGLENVWGRRHELRWIFEEFSRRQGDPAIWGMLSCFRRMALTIKWSGRVDEVNEWKKRVISRDETAWRGSGPAWVYVRLYTLLNHIQILKNTLSGAECALHKIPLLSSLWSSSPTNSYTITNRHPRARSTPKSVVILLSSKARRPKVKWLIFIFPISPIGNSAGDRKSFRHGEGSIEGLMDGGYGCNQGCLNLLVVFWLFWLYSSLGFSSRCMVSQSVEQFSIVIISGTVNVTHVAVKFIIGAFQTVKIALHQGRLRYFLYKFSLQRCYLIARFEYATGGHSSCR